MSCITSDESSFKYLNYLFNIRQLRYRIDPHENNSLFIHDDISPLWTPSFSLISRMNAHLTIGQKSESSLVFLIPSSLPRLSLMELYQRLSERHCVESSIVHGFFQETSSGLRRPQSMQAEKRKQDFFTFEVRKTYLFFIWSFNTKSLLYPCLNYHNSSLIMCLSSSSGNFAPYMHIGFSVYQNYLSGTDLTMASNAVCILS